MSFSLVVSFADCSQHGSKEDSKTYIQKMVTDRENKNTDIDKCKINTG